MKSNLYSAKMEKCNLSSRSDNDSLSSSETTSSPKPEKPKKLKRGAPPSAIQFPFKVHNMLEDAIIEGRDQVGNTGFKVHDKDVFVKYILS